MSTHPYYPPDLVIPNYEPNTRSLWALASVFSSVIGVFIGAVLAASHAVNGRLSRGEKLVISWFSLCGFLHCFFEGYFVLFHASIAGRQSLFAQLWKEYSLSDSRYLVSDPFMVCIETVTTLLWGPLSLAAAAATALRSRLKPLLVAGVAVGHLYGVTLYYATCFAEHAFTGRSHSRPETVYFWVYYVGFNMPWVVVPAGECFLPCRALWGAERSGEERN
ncbi:hypothetical protein TD95_001837 [Thielaviopsis punctulata]|uniref:EXPERA domain-containing protein n=1 Tax=Thielaviopsis punctulata TaxID=72032 RepID=A0A0F4ZDS8_9PEZI|nr:hypothetical protein TD95_001837 [Thielaviopsis punctulata]